MFAIWVSGILSSYQTNNRDVPFTQIAYIIFHPSYMAEMESFWVVIPHYVLTNSNLTAGDKILYGELSSLTRKDGKCYATNRHFQEVLGITERSVSTGLKRLQREGFIEVVVYHEKDGKVGTYRDIILTEATGGSQKEQGGVENISRGGRKNCYPKERYTREIHNTVLHTVEKSVQEDTISHNEEKKKVVHGNEDINTCTEYLTQKLGTALDGTLKENRQYCYNLLRKVKKEYPDANPVDNVKLLIDVAMQDRFHSRNATGFKYLFYNMARISQSFKSEYGVGDKSDIDVIL